MTPQLDVFSIVVSDMAASVAFYRKLGLAFPEGAENEGHTEAPLGGGLRLALDTEEVIASFAPGWQPPTGPGRSGIAFRCADPAEVDKLWGELVDAGYHGELAPWDAVWGQRYATLADPDGQGIDLYAPLPSE
ncbi:VOC family protein [Nocardia rhizosphaerihabitans]|uniref:Glyoxalase n=1 Tax=Nocardia rhizosphaerihabitans TaxID=1691570 RepID=A0ABQ2KBG2_9NOCA|nr:VOC family protein [Nocardia rhizosphaerihabitans]GGN77310.1 glyoxalase [Nocardia rhizosphaerihabitans]